MFNIEDKEGEQVSMQIHLLFIYSSSRSTLLGSLHNNIL